MLKKNSSPHILSDKTSQNVMRDVIIAVIPCVLFSFFVFGINALLVCVTSVTACIFFEHICYKYWVDSKNAGVCDLSAVLTGILLACSVPSNLPLYMVIIGAFVAIVIAKMLFGGLGANIFNPALTGRAFIFLAFPAYMTTWTKPSFHRFLHPDMQTGATTLEVVKYSDVATSATRLQNNDFVKQIPEYYDLIIGNISGSLGEISVIAIVLGYLYLFHKKIITWHIPIIFVATVFAIMFLISLFSNEPFKYNSMIHILSGGLLFGAVFMATDYVTSPMSKLGKIIFAIGCGVLTVVIRLYSVYTEGVSFAILIMNGFVPIIDKFTRPRVYGRKKAENIDEK